MTDELLTAGDLPFWCRLRGHGRWRRLTTTRAGWWRPTCDRCRRLIPPTPEDQ